tara:strand:- start:15 stop:209 length:195 start_codon:yes stop_codon:yes gene_type:complete
MASVGQLEVAKNRLYEKSGLDVSNFKMFPGAVRDVTAEQIAEQLNKAIAQVQSGDFEDVDGTDE